MFICLMNKAKVGISEKEIIDVLDVCDQNGIAAAVLDDEAFANGDFKQVRWNFHALKNLQEVQIDQFTYECADNNS